MTLKRKLESIYLSPNSLKTQLFVALKISTAFKNLCSRTVSKQSLGNAAAGVALKAFLKPEWLKSRRFC